MAIGLVFHCTDCAFRIEAWDEGDPYYFDEEGSKQYAYHPDPERDRCTGIESPVLCLDCGTEATSKSEVTPARCANCSGNNLHPTFELNGKRCPHCRVGTLISNPDEEMIS